MIGFDIYQITDQIAGGQPFSVGFKINGNEVVGLIMPSAWDAAGITLQGSVDNVTWVNLFDTAGSEITLQAAASRYIVIPATLLPGLEWIRARSGTSGTPVAQITSRTLTWMARSRPR